MRLGVAAAALTAAAFACACGSYTDTPVSPTAPQISVAFSMGTWSSSTTAAASQTGKCTATTWNITSVNETEASGTFSATCSGYLVSGSGFASATRDRTSIAWTAGGIASGTGTANCMVGLTGTVDVVSEGLRISYGGSGCFGNILGTEHSFASSFERGS